MEDREQLLTGGRMTDNIVRRGDRVYRPLGSWSAAVHEYLRHLESVGFTGAPGVVGVEGGREILTYIDGDVAVDPQWQPGHGARLPPYARTERALTGAAELVRRLHRAAAGFEPTITGYRFPLVCTPGRPDRFVRRPRPVEHGLPWGDPGGVHRLGRRSTGRPDR